MALNWPAEKLKVYFQIRLSHKAKKNNPSFPGEKPFSSARTLASGMVAPPEDDRAVLTETNSAS